MESCPSLEQLGQLQTAKQDTPVDHSVRTHVDGCPRCQQRVKELDSKEVSGNAPALRVPIGTVDFDPEPPQPSSEGPGTVIGPYKLRQKLGDGGMGAVYEAEQERPIRRRVALKLIKPGMDSERVIARFEAERQALALMSHANIAKVLDAGTTPSGRPFFVMELVPGVPIAQYCNDSRLTLRERLELFIPVCEAIQHAHQKGVIHRDIKPSNILVTLSDGTPTPKVIDFGLAKATERLSEHSMFTEYGAMAVFRIGDLVDQVLGELARRDVALTIYDEEAAGPAIYQTSTSPRRTAAV